MHFISSLNKTLLPPSSINTRKILNILLRGENTGVECGAVKLGLFTPANVEVPQKKAAVKDILLRRGLERERKPARRCWPQEHSAGDKYCSISFF